jgi:hypothetical protein
VFLAGEEFANSIPSLGTEPSRRLTALEARFFQRCEKLLLASTNGRTIL